MASSSMGENGPKEDLSEIVARAAREREAKKLRQSTISTFWRDGVDEVSRGGSIYTAAEKAGMTVPEYLVLHPAFDALMGVVIILNFLVIFAQLEWKGYDISHQLGLRQDDGGWKEAEAYFDILEKLFNGAYLLELVLRLSFTRRAFLRDSVNICDAFVIITCCVESFILAPLFTDASSNSAARIASLLRVIRVMRALRLLRFVRILRMMGMFSALRVLLKTLSKSMQSLVWSMLVLACIVLASALLVVQLTVEYLQDETKPLEQRREVSYYFGSAAKASFTMFEATFTAKWATHFSRPLMEFISPWFSVFWILFTVTINFAVVRVIAALFLKQTMDVASVDAERMALVKMQDQANVMSMLREIFRMGDQTQDGVLHKWEFEQMMQNEDVVSMFEELELEAPELHLLFDLLAEDDEVADQEEFLSGAMKLKSSVRIVDMIQVLHAQRVSRRYMKNIAEGIEILDRALHPSYPWKASRCSVLAHAANQGQNAQSCQQAATPSSPGQQSSSLAAPHGATSMVSLPARASWSVAQQETKPSPAPLMKQTVSEVSDVSRNCQAL